MIEERELITLLLALCAMAFAVKNRQVLVSIPGMKRLLWAPLVLTFGLVFSILEGIFWSDLVNALEHICFGLSSMLLAAALWRWPRSREIEP